MVQIQEHASLGISPLVHDIRTLASSWSISFCFVSRNCNKAAHWLASRARFSFLFSDWVRCPPPKLALFCNLWWLVSVVLLFFALLIKYMILILFELVVTMAWTLIDLSNTTWGQAGPEAHLKCLKHAYFISDSEKCNLVGSKVVFCALYFKEKLVLWLLYSMFFRTLVLI